jgi:hypothetical protein
MGDQPSATAAPPAAQQTRWMGVGRCDHPDARSAGQRAAGDALSGDDPKLVVVFCSDAYDLHELLAGVRDCTGDVALIGCSTAGELATDGACERSIVVTVLGGPGFTVSTRAAITGPSSLREAGANVARAVRGVEGCEHRVLMLLSDGLAGDQQELVRGAYGVVGAGVPLVGGCAGDELKFVRTFQLHDDRVLSDAVVGAAIGSDAPLGIGVRHGWRRSGEPVVVTCSARELVHTLDHQPALDVYFDRLGAPPEARVPGPAFEKFVLMHPLGLARRRGEEHVRGIAGADFASRSLICIAPVPQGALTWFMNGDDASVLAATDVACSDALLALGDQPALGMIAFDCSARRGILGSAIQAETDRLSVNARGAPVAGFYTYGEIARTRGLSGFHNQTLVVLAVG